MMKTIVFLGSKPIGLKCFEHLLALRSEGFELVGYSTKRNINFPESELESLAQEHGIDRLDSLDYLPTCDFIVSVQHHEILRANHIQKANELAINLHMASLPEYRGCNQFSFAILDKMEEFGTTLHRLEESIDGGDIIAERRFSIAKGIFVNELYELTFQHSINLFKEEIQNIMTGNYQLTPQASFQNRKRSLHYRREIDEIKKINLEWSEEKINRHIRATLMPGFSPPYAIENEEKIELKALVD